MHEKRMFLSKKRYVFLPLLLLAVLFTCITAMAAESELDRMSKEQTFLITASDTQYGIPCDRGGKIIKSSFKTKGSAAAKIDFNYSKNEKTYYINIQPKKPGKALVSFKYKWKGKTKKYTFIIQIRKYVNPVKTFKVGSENYAAAFKKDFKKYINKKISGKVNVKAKKGWTLTSLSFSSGGDYKDIKNGTKVTLKKNTMLLAHFADKNDNVVTVQLARWE